MDSFNMDRRGFLAATMVAIASGHMSTLLTEDASEEIELSRTPTRTFWAPDIKSPESTESCFFLIRRKGAGAPPASEGVVELHAAGKLVETVRHSAASLDSIKFVASNLDSVFYMFYIRVPAKLGIDTIKVVLHESGKKGTITVKPEHYTQQNKLIFPFVGPAIVSQGGFNNGGHANGSSQFAIDALGLSDNYGPQLDSRNTNESYAGWGRPIIAPGDGTIVHAQDGIPNQAKPESMDAKVYTLANGLVVSQGNHVIIDHGSGEFSELMHMQTNSIAVKVGDKVKKGQSIGKLGNSGNSFGPHLHFQLMDGPNFATASGLPVVFENVKQTLERGVYFNPTVSPDTT